MSGINLEFCEVPAEVARVRVTQGWQIFSQYGEKSSNSVILWRKAEAQKDTGDFFALANTVSKWEEKLRGLDELHKRMGKLERQICAGDTVTAAPTIPLQPVAVGDWEIDTREVYRWDRLPATINLAIEAGWVIVSVVTLPLTEHAVARVVMHRPMKATDEQ